MRVESLIAIDHLLTSDRITYKGNEVRPLAQILAEIQADVNSQRAAQRVTPAPQPEPVIVKPEPGPRVAVAEDFMAAG